MNHVSQREIEVYPNLNNQQPVQNFCVLVFVDILCILVPTKKIVSNLVLHIL